MTLTSEETLQIERACERLAPDHFGRPADAKQLVGEFEDEFERTPHGWQIRARLARFVLHT
jgi:hypothetical protein